MSDIDLNKQIVEICQNIEFSIPNLHTDFQVTNNTVTILNDLFGLHVSVNGCRYRDYYTEEFNIDLNGFGTKDKEILLFNLEELVFNNV
jgi:hypothetical protein